jgi:hypothetical protein
MIIGMQSRIAPFLARPNSLISVSRHSKVKFAYDDNKSLQQEFCDLRVKPTANTLPSFMSGMVYLPLML